MLRLVSKYYLPRAVGYRVPPNGDHRIALAKVYRCCIAALSVQQHNSIYMNVVAGLSPIGVAFNYAFIFSCYMYVFRLLIFSCRFVVSKFQCKDVSSSRTSHQAECEEQEANAMLRCL